MCVVLTMSLLEHTPDESRDKMLQWKTTLAQWIDKQADVQKDLVLFAVRQESSGGTSDIASAVRKVKSDRFPESMRTHEILDEILLGIRSVSPLACLPGFSDGL